MRKRWLPGHDSRAQRPHYCRGTEGDTHIGAMADGRDLSARDARTSLSDPSHDSVAIICLLHRRRAGCDVDKPAIGQERYCE